MRERNILKRAMQATASNVKESDKQFQPIFAHTFANKCVKVIANYFKDADAYPEVVKPWINRVYKNFAMIEGSFQVYPYGKKKMLSFIVKPVIEEKKFSACATDINDGKLVSVARNRYLDTEFDEFWDKVEDGDEIYLRKTLADNLDNIITASIDARPNDVKRALKIVAFIPTLGATVKYMKSNGSFSSGKVVSVSDRGISIKDDETNNIDLCQAGAVTEEFDSNEAKMTPKEYYSKLYPPEFVRGMGA